MPFLKKYKEPRSRILEESTKKNGLRHAVFTIKGDKYVGEWKDNLKHGKGAHLSRRKQLYEGDWVKGMRHGYGVLSQILPDGSFILLYEGDWLNDKPEGFGRKHYPNDEFYEGEIKEGKRHGHGRMWYDDCSFYDGQWNNDMRHGLGLFVSSNGNRYEGQWRTDKKHGYGEFYHLDSGQMQWGLWNHGIAICTNMRDILFRQACYEPTPYPILKVELLDPDGVYQRECEQYAQHIASEQEEPQQKLQEVRTSPNQRPTLSPWFYVDCCDKKFPKKI